jgi:hypothetical protein
MAHPDVVGVVQVDQILQMPQLRQQAAAAMDLFIL